MSKPASPKSARIGIPAATLGAVSLLLVGSGVVVRHEADARWHAMAAAAEADRVAWEHQDFSRSPLWGEATAGNAFESYGRMAALAGSFDRDDAQRRLAALATCSAEFDESGRALLEQWQPVVAELRAGARCGEARPLTRVQDGFQARVTNLLWVRAAVNAAGAMVRLHAAESRPMEAAQLALDTATVGGDLLRSPLLIEQVFGAAMLAIPVKETLCEDVLAKLDKASLELLAAGLERLDAHVPSVLPLQESMLLAHGLLGSPVNLFESAGVTTLSSWRYGFSERWMFADAWRVVRDHERTHFQPSQQPWTAREQRLRNSVEALALVPNPALAVIVPNLTSAEHSKRTAVVELRMLRLAVDVRLGNHELELVDPLGNGAIQRVEDPMGVRFASAGKVGGKPMCRYAAKT